MVMPEEHWERYSEGETADKNTTVEGLSPDHPLPFSDMSSLLLTQIKEPLYVALKIGDAKKDFVIEIPPPEKSQLKTAQQAHKTTTNKRHKILLKAIEKTGDAWLTAYMCVVYREKDADLNWLDPNHYFSYELSADRTFMSSACKNSKPEITGILLQTDGVRINNQRLDPLWAAIHNKDQQHSFAILKMLCSYRDTIIGDSVIRYAQTKTIRDMLKQAQKDRLQQKQELQEKQQKALPSSATDAEVREEEDGTVWTKLDTGSICKITQDGTGFRLRKIFNFESATMSESHEHLDADGNLKTATAPAVTPFRQLGNKAEIEKAQQKLRAMNAGNNTQPKK